MAFETIDHTDEETRPDQQKTNTKTNTFRVHLQRAILETFETLDKCDLSHRTRMTKKKKIELREQPRPKRSILQTRYIWLIDLIDWKQASLRVVANFNRKKGSSLSFNQAHLCLKKIETMNVDVDVVLNQTEMQWVSQLPQLSRIALWGCSLKISLCLNFTQIRIQFPPYPPQNVLLECSSFQFTVKFGWWMTEANWGVQPNMLMLWSCSDSVKVGWKTKMIPFDIKSFFLDMLLKWKSIGIGWWP